ncbi:MAG: InlB B-repeat-containing protein, partial [Bacteroidota bacterium]
QDSLVFIQNNFGIPDNFGDNAVMSHNFSTGTAIENNYFTDAANGDFTLTSNAVEAIDSGANVSPYNGLVKDAPDIGAYEYGKTKWTAGATTTPITTYELSLSADNGGKVHPGNGPVREGEVFAIEAEDVLGAVFNQWSGDATGSENPKEITMNSDITAKGEFSPVATYNLNIEKTNGSVRLFPGGGTYNTGTEVELTAIPASQEYYFSDWTGDITDSANPVSVIMDENYTITANFPANPKYLLTIETTEGGSVDISPDQADYLEGTVVNIIAKPDSAYKFVNWTGDASVSDSVIRQDITMDHDITLTAHFVSTAGMDDLNSALAGVNIYPNPNNGEEVNILLNGNSETVEVSIYSLTGAKLYSGSFNSNAFTIPLSGIEAIKSGYYLMEIKSNNQIIRKKLIVD